MAVRITQKSGLASDTSVWDGGTALVDGDTIVVTASHVLTWDLCATSWVTGVQSILIRGIGSGTPGQLTFPNTTAACSFYLPISQGGGISSNNTLNPGQFYVASISTPQFPAAPVTIRFLGVATNGIDAMYTEYKVYCTEPAIRWARLVNTEAQSSYVLELDTDVTSYWFAGDTVGVCMARNSSGWTCITTLSSVSSGAIYLPTSANGLASSFVAGSFVALVSRSVRVHHNSGSISNVYCLSQAVDNHYYWEFRHLGYQNATGGNGRGYYQCNRPGNIVGGTVVGHAVAWDWGAGQFCGVAIGSQGLNSSTGSSRNTAYVKNAGFFGGGCAISGGAGTVIHSSCVIGCMAYGARGEAMVAGRVLACDVGIWPTATVVHESAVVGGSGVNSLDANNTDVKLFQPGTTAGGWPSFYVEGYGASLRSATQVSQYLATTVNTGEIVPPTAVCLFDVGDSSGTKQPGQLAWWTGGGSGKSEPTVVATHGTPPAPMAFVHKMNFESGYSRNYIDIPLNVPRNQTAYVTVWAKKSGNGMMTTPKFSVIERNREWQSSLEYISVSTMTDDTNWQTLLVKYSATEDKQVSFRAEGCNTTGYLYWNYDIAMVGAPTRANIGGRVAGRVG